MPHDRVLRPVEIGTDVHEQATVRHWDYDRAGDAYAIQCSCGWWTPSFWYFQEALDAFAVHVAKCSERAARKKAKTEAKEQAVRQVAKWLAAAAGEDEPSVLTLGDASDLLDGLVADGLVTLSSPSAASRGAGVPQRSGEPPRSTLESTVTDPTAQHPRP